MSKLFDEVNENVYSKSLDGLVEQIRILNEQNEALRSEVRLQRTEIKDQNEALKVRVDSFESSMEACSSHFNKLNKNVVEVFSEEYSKKRFEGRKSVIDYFSKGIFEDIKEELNNNKTLLKIRYIYV